MTKEKKQEISNEENKKQEVKLPQLSFAYLGVYYVQNEKGLYMLSCPVNTTLEDALKCLKFLEGKIEKGIEENKKKQEEKAKKEEEANKPPAKNVVKGDFKVVE